MASVGEFAHTPHGIGEIREIDSVRGRRSFKVAGRNFSVWVDETSLHVASGDNPEFSDIPPHELAMDDHHDAHDGQDYAPLHFSGGLETTIEQGPVNDNNSTVLPYNPSPQHNVDMFRDEQTIQPGDYEIDPDDRLHSSDSVSGNDHAPNRPYPGPAEHLFAKSSARGDEVYGYGPDQWHDYINHENHHGWMSDEDAESGHHSVDHHLGAAADTSDWDEGPTRPDQYDDQWSKGLGDQQPLISEGAYRFATGEEVPGVGDIGSGGADFSPVNPFPGPISHSGSPQFMSPGVSQFMDNKSGTVASYRPAGLSDRYAHFDIEAHDGMDSVSQFRRDPVTFIEGRNYMLSSAEDGDYLHQKFADYTGLIDVDEHMRTAAWSDTRSKALQLRHQGRVHVRDLGTNRIYATVEGDHGTYDTMIAKSGALEALGGGSDITTWHCGCEWGRWASQNKMTHVGRLCPHAYAAYLSMQQGSQRTADVVDRFKSWSTDQNNGHLDEASIDDFLNQDDQDATPEDVDKLYQHVLNNPVETPERKYDIDYTLDPEKAYKQADALRQRPKSLTPDMHEVPKEDTDEWVDVTKDDRETTGPDQIMHFSAVMAKLHWADGPMPEQVDSPQASAQIATDADTEVGNSIMARLHRADRWDDGEPQDDSQPTPNPFQGLINNVKTHLQHSDYDEQHPLNSNGEPVQQSAPAAQPQSSGVDMSGVEGLGNPNGGNLGVEDYNRGGQGTAELAGETGTSPGGFDPHGQQTGVGLISDPSKSTLTPGSAKPSNYDEMVKNTVGEGNQGHNTGQGAGASGNMGTGSGYGGAGFQGDNGAGGDWLKSNETSGIHGDYTIKPGDTLHDISQRSGISVDDIAKHNNISDVNSINSGTKLQLPGATGGPGQPPAAGPGPGAKPPTGTLVNQTSPAPSAVGQLPPVPQLPATNSGGVGSAGTTPKLPQLPQPTKPAGPSGMGKKSYRQRLAEQSDGQVLDKIRDISAESPEDSLGHMDSRNDELRDLIDEAQNRGMDASFMVAHLLHAEIDSPKVENNGKGSFMGVSAPDDPDHDFAGSGPDPKDWFSDSASYVDSKERPHIVDDWTEGDGDIIKYNDGRSKPPQGPRNASLHYADDSATIGQMGGVPDYPATDYSNPGDVGGGTDIMARLHRAEIAGEVGESYPTGEDWDNGAGAPFRHDDGQQPQHHGGPGFPEFPEMGEAGEGAAAAEMVPVVARRVGGGPRQQVRVDPGFRGQQRRQAAAPPEDFGYNGDSFTPEAVDPTGSDIVANFQRSGAAGDIMTNRQSSSSSDDIAGAAQAFLRTAGRKFSPDEQRMLEAEAHPLGARNLPTDDDLQGTHYLLGL